MNVRTFYVGALLVAGALPLAGHLVPLRAGEHARPPERATTVAWPTHFRDQPLTQLPPGALEERFARRFPGAIARFTDGQRVLVQRNGNMAFDCTDEVHPEVAYMAGLATRAVGLDIAGIDMVTTDIGQPLQLLRMSPRTQTPAAHG